ncbi:MAG: cyclase family protein, partial [Candidatus Kerfeldbacteria bacterium]|nr:cyclase family protein [Candidatus Kerfeldbacteria bacterium]
MPTKQIIDISLPIVEGMITYPGDVAPTIVGPNRKPGSRTFGSRLLLGSHTGTHMDAPRHVSRDADGSERIPLETLIGPCRVLDCTAATSLVKVEHLRPHRIKRGERILLKTRNSARGFRRFPD